MAILTMVLLWHGGVRRLTQAATFTDGLFRDCSHMLDSIAGKVIFAAACIWNPFPNTHCCSQLAQWKWSMPPFDAVSYPQRAQSRRKTAGSLSVLRREYEVLGTGHLDCRCPENPQQLPFGSLEAACQSLAGGRHCSPLCTTIIAPTEHPSLLGLFNRAAHGQLTHQCQLSPLLVSIAVRAQLHHGFSKCSAPESLSVSPSAIESWAFPNLIWGLFSEIYLCWNMAFLLSFLIYIVLLWERLGQSCVALCYFSAVLVAMP